MFLPENQFLNFPLIFSASAKLPTVDDNSLGIFFFAGGVQKEIGYGNQNSKWTVGGLQFSCAKMFYESILTAR